MDAIRNCIIHQSPLYVSLNKPQRLQCKEIQPFNPKDPLPVNVLVRAIQGKRDYMEDTYCVHELPGISYYAVFDGHGGDKVSKRLQEQFFKHLIQELRNLPNIHDVQSVKQTLKQAFVKFDHYLYLESDNELIGSTGIVLLKIGNKVYIANLGDSRAVVFSPNGFYLETFDHKPDKEIDRIARAGGNVIAGRVNGLLAISRAFGDNYLKRGRFGNREYMGPNSPVCPVPDVYIFDLEQTGEVIAILASDGVWDRVTGQEITKIKPDRRFCDRIVSMAYERGSEDNITAMAVKLFPQK